MTKHDNILFYILIRHWRAFEYFDKCINSVFYQTYSNYKIIFIDDNSEYDKYRKRYIEERLKNHFVIFNKVRKYSLRNAYDATQKYMHNNRAVVVNLDADDWFYSDKTLEIIANIYNKHPEILFSYGNCVLYNGIDNIKVNQLRIKHLNKRYSKNVDRNGTHKLQLFRVLHPRTWKVSAFKKIKVAEFMRDNGNWIRFAEDQAILYPLLKMAKGNYFVSKKLLYVYNIANQMRDSKKNSLNQMRDEFYIRYEQGKLPAKS